LWNIDGFEGILVIKRDIVGLIVSISPAIHDLHLHPLYSFQIALIL